MSNSPNGLNTASPSVARMSRWPLYAAIFGFSIMGIVLIYSVNFAHDPQKEVAKSKEVAVSETESTPLLPNTEKSGGVVGGYQAKPDKALEIEANQALLVVQESSAEDEAISRIKRQKSQAYIAALSAPLMAKNVSASSSSSAERDANTQANTIQSGARYSTAQASNTGDIYSGIGTENGYDPASDRDKEAFFERSQSGDSSWMLGNARMAGQKFEIKTGTVIPSVMISSINAELPGAIIAQVSQSVYDSSTGHNLLIPRGSRLYGAYDSRIIYGQSRVLVAWNRIIFPDGSAITLGAMPGSDMSGNAGFEDKVNNHYFRIFGSAVLMSLVSGGMAYGMDSMNTSSEDETSMQNEMATALAAQLGQTTTALLQKNLNIKPTLEIRTGYQFNIVVTKDIVFEKPYKAWR